MKYVTAVNMTRKTDLGQKIRVATSWVDRMVGLLTTERLHPGDGLWITPCRSIHTCFMRYPIDVLFLDDKGTVLAQQTLPPWRMSGWYLRSRGVLELAAGALQRTQTSPGDRIDLKAVI